MKFVIPPDLTLVVAVGHPQVNEILPPLLLPPFLASSSPNRWEADPPVMALYGCPKSPQPPQNAMRFMRISRLLPICLGPFQIPAPVGILPAMAPYRCPKNSSTASKYQALSSSPTFLQSGLSRSSGVLSPQELCSDRVESGAAED